MTAGSVHDRFEEIALVDGLSAVVRTECHDVALSNAVGAHPPTKQEWRAFIETLVSEPTRLPDYALLKYSKVSEVFSARWDRRTDSAGVLVKVSRGRGIGRRLMGLIRPSRSRRNLDRARGLMSDGIDTALPLAIVEQKGFGGKDWFVSTFIPELVDLDQMALTLLPRVNARSVRAVKNRLIDRAASLFARLQRAGWDHRDLKASNVMFTDWDGDAARVWLVDLDGLSRKRGRSTLDLTPVVRLAASFSGYRSVATTDGARFLMKLLGAFHGTSDGWRDALRAVVRGAGEYNRRARGRKGAKLDGFAGA